MHISQQTSDIEHAVCHVYGGYTVGWLPGWQLRRIIYCGYISRNTRRRAAIYARHEGIIAWVITREKEKEHLMAMGWFVGALRSGGNRAALAVRRKPTKQALAYIYTIFVRTYILAMATLYSLYSDIKRRSASRSLNIIQL